MAKSAGQNFSQNVDSYQDEEGLTVEKMRFGLWYLEHRQIILNVFLGVLIVIAVFSWGYTLISFGYYLLIGKAQDAKVIDDLVSSKIIGHEYVTGNTAKPMAISETVVLGSGDDYDFAATISNPNKWHWAEFEYSFNSGGVEYGKARAYILPNESKYLLALAQPAAGGSANANLVISNLVWNRIDRHVILDWDKFKAERYGIVTENEKYSPASMSGLSEKVGLNTLKFDTGNKSAYSFWSVDFAIILKRRGSIVGVNQYRLDEFMAGQNREVDASFPGQIGSVDSVEIYPYVNIIDEDSYINPDGGIGQEK